MVSILNFIKKQYSVFLVFIVLLIFSTIISYIFPSLFLTNEITNIALSLTVTIFIFMFTLSNYVISNMTDILTVTLISNYQYSDEQINFVTYQIISCIIYLVSLATHSYIISCTSPLNNSTIIVTPYTFWNNIIVISNFLIFGVSFYYLYKNIKLYFLFNKPTEIVNQIISNINQKKYSSDVLEQKLEIISDIIINYSKIDDRITKNILKKIIDLIDKTASEIPNNENKKYFLTNMVLVLRGVLKGYDDLSKCNFDYEHILIYNCVITLRKSKISVENKLDTFIDNEFEKFFNKEYKSFMEEHKNNYS